MIWKNSKLFFPTPRRLYSPTMSRFKDFHSRLRFLLKKYSFKPFVEVEPGDIVCDVGAYLGEFSLAVGDIASKIIAMDRGWKY